jgi:hypothetical protein
MSAERGYTVVELLVAAGVLLLVLTGLSAVMHDAILRVPWLEESTDLQQRTRAALEQLSSDLRAAGAGEHAGTLMSHLPVVLPRGAMDPPTAASASVLTVRYVPEGGAGGRLGDPLLPADSVLTLSGSGPCVSNALACGFRAGSTALVFDGTGQGDVLAVDAIASGVLTTSPVQPRVASYPLDAGVVELLEVTYSLDPVSRTLGRRAGGLSLPVADNVTALQFEYSGMASRPTLPRPPLGTANCLYAADGTYLHAVLPPDGPPVVITPGELSDGPFCGSGALAFDIDLLRIRSLRVRLRLDTGVATLRGPDPSLFARPGQSQDSRVIHDVHLTVGTSLRNVAR